MCWCRVRVRGIGIGGVEPALATAAPAGARAGGRKTKWVFLVRTSCFVVAVRFLADLRKGCVVGWKAVVLCCC